MQRKADHKVTRESTKIIIKTPDSKYKKVNLEDISQSAHQLDAKDKFMLL